MKEAINCLILKKYSFKVRRLIINAFATTDFPEEWRKEVFEFLGHSGAINKIHYCMPDVKKMYQLIAPVLDKIDAKYEDGLQGDKGILENDTERQLTIPVQMSPASSIYASSPATSLFESYDSDSSEDEKEFKRGKRLRWKKEHNDIITEEFFGFLSGQKEYPSKEDLKKFFHAYPDILSDFSVKEKYDKIRVKLNNSKRIIKMNKKIHEIKIKKV